MTTKMRAKMKVAEVTNYGPDSEMIRMTAVCPKLPYPADGSDEDNTFAKYTPNADLKMQIMNPELVGKFPLGTVLYVDFTPV